MSVRVFRCLVFGFLLIVVALPLDPLDDPRLTAVTRMLLEVSVETRLRHALQAAGYRHISRRGEVPGVLVLDARA